MQTYRSASGSVAEDLFIGLFGEAFGAEKPDSSTLSITSLTSTRTAVTPILCWKTAPAG